MPPNFVFFIPDEMRAESLGAFTPHALPASLTPNITRLAADGTRFDQCHVQHTVCTPSRCSFTTGWYPHVRGHRTLWHMLTPEEPNLLRYLKQAGYEVHWGGKNDLLSPGAFADCVDDYRLGDRSLRPRPHGHGQPPYALDDPRYYSFLYEPIEGGIEAIGDYCNVDGAIEFLRSRKPGDGKPFVLYLPLTFPHCPYHAPEPFHSLVSPDDVPALRPPDLPGKPSYHRLMRQARRLDQLDGAFFRTLQAVYLGMIATTDAMLGLLLDALDQTGHAADTALFFFSDHGDWAGDYGLVEKWPSALDDCLTRIPLIVRAPGMTRGHVVSEPVEALDVMATALDLAGIPAQHTHFARSLVPQLGGAAGDPDRAVFSEGGYDPHEPHAFEGRVETGQGMRSPAHIYYPKGRLQQDVPESVCRATSIRTMTHRLVRRPLDTSELYDLTRDPRELENVYDRPEHAAVQRDLERRMLDWSIHTADVVPYAEHPRGLPGVAPLP
ncbi:MAG TPA: sulfatase-like hydrolase/transferase [Chloroflexota bacterium]|nr:sulfatase-like hydrolase/transferase [Chloroflexota bacterium]